MPLLELVGGPEDGLSMSLDEVSKYVRVPVPAYKGPYDPTTPVVKPAIGLYKMRGDGVVFNGHILFDWDGEL